MFKYFHLLGQLIMAFSVLFIVLKMGSIYTAIALFCLGTIIYIFGKKISKK